MALLSVRDLHVSYGAIKAVRVYSRVLTEDELRWNRLVDEQRFFGDPGTVLFMR